MGELLAGRFELLESIGAGASGTVWTAFDHRTNRLVAAKVLRQSDAASVLRFGREVSHRIDSPHVLMPIGTAADDDRVVIAMPLKRGGSLRTLLADFGALPRRWVIELGAQAAGAIAAVHAAGVIHRDIKPENLLLDATGAAQPVLYLADFGAALEPTDARLSIDGSVTGTPGYLAPEAVAGEPPQYAHDLYSLGAVLRDLLFTGQGLRDGDSDLLAIVRDLLGEDPASRPSAAEVAHALAGLRDDPWEEGADDVEVFEQVPLPALPTGRVVVPRLDDRDATLALAAEPRAVSAKAPIADISAKRPTERVDAAVGSTPANNRHPAALALAIAGVVLIAVAVIAAIVL